MKNTSSYPTPATLAKLDLVVALATLVGLSLIMGVVMVWEGNPFRAVLWSLSIAGMSSLMYGAGRSAQKAKESDASSANDN